MAIRFAAIPGIGNAMLVADLSPEPRDIFVVVQKVVSKAESHLVDLATVIPSLRARTLPTATGKAGRHTCIARVHQL